MPGRLDPRTYQPGKKERISMSDAEKAAWKTKLETVGKALNESWHSPMAHKVLVGCEMLDILGVKDSKKREEALSKWMRTPPSLGANCSAFAQLLGRETTKEKMERTFSGL
jgi:hypothetical protein